MWVVIISKYIGVLAERLRQWIANPSLGNRWVGSIPTYSAKLKGLLWQLMKFLKKPMGTFPKTLELILICRGYLHLEVLSIIGLF